MAAKLSRLADAIDKGVQKISFLTILKRDCEQKICFRPFEKHWVPESVFKISNQRARDVKKASQIGDSNRDHETSSKRWRLERFTK